MLAVDRASGCPFGSESTEDQLMELRVYPPLEEDRPVLHVYDPATAGESAGPPWMPTGIGAGCGYLAVLLFFALLVMGWAVIFFRIVRDSW